MPVIERHVAGSRQESAFLLLRQNGINVDRVYDVDEDGWAVYVDDRGQPRSSQILGGEVLETMRSWDVPAAPPRFEPVREGY